MSSLSSYDFPRNLFGTSRVPDVARARREFLSQLREQLIALGPGPMPVDRLLSVTGTLAAQVRGKLIAIQSGRSIGGPEVEQEYAHIIIAIWETYMEYVDGERWNWGPPPQVTCSRCSAGGSMAAYGSGNDLHLMRCSHCGRRLPRPANSAGGSDGLYGGHQ